MDYDDLKKEKLNKLERKLYSRKGPDIIDAGRTELTQEREVESSVLTDSLTTPQTGWQTPQRSSFDELAGRAARAAQSKHGFVKKIFIGSIVFFILSVAIASVIFFGGVNFISSAKVDIKVDGPLSVPGGQESAFDVHIINNNNTDLQSVALSIEYPKGTRSAVDITKELDHERFTLQNITSGQSYVQPIKAIFFGEKDKPQDIKISLEYRIANSSALFYKDATHEVTISSAPVIITPTYPKEVNSNQDISFNVEVASNSKDSLDNFLVHVEYPFGFVFKESTPQASFNNNIWKFNTLASGDKKTIKIKGTIIGQDNEERVFHIDAGTANKDDERQIAVPIAQLIESLTVKKPFVGVNFLVEGQDQDYSASGGGQLGAEVDVLNNLPTRLFNASVSVSFSGGAFDQLSVVPNTNGFFQSFNNSIIWDKQAVPELSDIAPGKTQKLYFRLTPLDYSKIPAGTPANILMTVNIKGERALDSGSVEQVNATETRKITLGSNVSLVTRVGRSIGSIESSGDVPPQVNNPVDYTINWAIKNSLNQVSNVTVKAKLPPYVKWTNVKTPSSEIISYDSTTNEVTWNVGSILPQSASSGTGRQAYFQVEFLPSTSQIGQTPVILNESTFSGIDKVTGLKITTQTGAVTTNFAGDSTYKQGDEKVVQ